ncbi:MAG: hypothetical protein ACI9R3_002573 [Verrucomicrobiales bacterium]|jgi:hypothetical protein
MPVSFSVLLLALGLVFDRRSSIRGRVGAQAETRVHSELGFRESKLMDLITLTLDSIAGWMNRQPQVVIDYLQKKVRVLLHGALSLREKSRPESGLNVVRILGYYGVTNGVRIERICSNAHLFVRT